MYRLTLRRRLPDGKLEEATYTLSRYATNIKEVLEHSGTPSEVEGLLLVDMEVQANNGFNGGGRSLIRAWVHEIPDDGELPEERGEDWSP